MIFDGRRNFNINYVLFKLHNDIVLNRHNAIYKHKKYTLKYYLLNLEFCEHRYHQVCELTQCSRILFLSL